MCRFIKGCYNKRPPPGYTETWDVSIVLKYLKTLSPVAKISLKDLTLKLLMLTAILNPQRCQSFHALSVSNEYMCEGKSKYVLKIPILMKQCKPGVKVPLVEMKAYPPDRRLCIYTVMSEYLNRTADVRLELSKKDIDGNQLFLSFIKPYKPVSKDTVSRWIKLVLKLAGINVSQYKSHSLRHASTSKAMSLCVPINEILAKAGWADCKMFSIYYNKLIEKQKFEESILQNVSE